MVKNTKIFSRGFLKGLVIYAVCFLVLAAVGLAVFWQFIESYELSRPRNTLNAYISQLTVEQMCRESDSLYATVDSNVQDRESFDRVIRDAVTEPVNYVKRSSESTQERQVYVLRTGKTPIGTLIIEMGSESSFGFRVWEVAETSFDFSYLTGQPVRVTVPADYRVAFNGTELNERYITQSGIHYAALEEFYDSYELPAMVTYTVENFLGEGTLDVYDREGNPVEITPETDMDSLLPRCGEEEYAAIEAFAWEYANCWVNFSGSTKSNASGNLTRLSRLLASDGVLRSRFRSALAGLTYGQTRGVSLQDVTVHRIVPLGDGRYMCDMTYIARTVGHKGAVDISGNTKILIVTEGNAYKVKSMERY